jgi:uncharacterized protein YndB with AHSA1/START domain
MEAKTFYIERVFDAPRTHVWQALTDKEWMKQWYFDLAEFKPEVGFVFEFTGGEEGGLQFLHRCEITEVIPFLKLTHTWSYVGYEGTSYLTFELSDDGDGTKLALTHAGIETFSPIPAFAFHNFETGWNFIINTSLKTFIQNKFKQSI